MGQSNLFYSDPDGAKGTKSPVGWIMAGSDYEDVPWYRGQNHFYDPTKKPAIGLTDGVTLPWVFPSFTWATVETNGVFFQHSYTWLKARNFELNALTNSCKSGRETNLAAMLFYLGHVMHLNQDLTVPAHVRNDNHGVNAADGPFAYFVMWTEIYGRKTYYANAIKSSEAFAKAFPTQQHGWSWWQNTAGFQKLEDFWNRDMLRTNGANALALEAKGDVTLGLSEFCNGNFISEHAIYNECKNSAKHTFSFPSLETSTRFPEIRKNPAAYVKTSYLSNGKPINRVTIPKVSDGITVSNHSVLNYLGAKFPTVPTKHNFTIHDTNVLQEYHSILIPKAIEYSAGILDYFFRGTMDVGLNLDTNVGPYTVTNLNTSGQDFYGGAFYLFGEINGIRTLIVSSNWSGYTLSNGGSMTMTFTDPPPPGTRFFSVYQGTIGMANGAALDPVETNIAIAVGRPWIEKPKTYDSYQPSTNDVGSTITTYLESDDFAFTPTAGNYEVLINYAKFDDTGTIGGVSCQWSNSPSCTLLDEITNTIVLANKVTVVGNHLRVPVTATDDPVCGGQVGWWTITITWRAWPSQ